MGYLYDRRITFDMPTKPWPHTGIDEKIFFPKIGSLSFELSFSSESDDSAPLPTELAGAGFYYTGQADWVECFQCGTNLQSWQPSGSPWHRHAR